MIMDRKEVLTLREEGLTMYEIAVKIAPKYESVIEAKNYDKMIEKLICMNGGVYDIVMTKPGTTGYDEEGLKNLSEAVVRNAIDEYGEWLTLLNDTPKPPSYLSRKKVLAKIVESVGQEKIIYQRYNDWYDYKAKAESMENFFKSDLCDHYLGLFDDLKMFHGKDIPEIIRKQAEEGRWKRFDYMIFKTKEEAEACWSKYPYARNHYVVVKDIPKGTKRKGKVWTMRKKEEVSE